MQQGLGLSTEETPTVKTGRLPVLPCPVCGELAPPVVGPGAGQHVARALCPHGHFIKWLPKALFGGRQEGRSMGGIARCTVVGCVGKQGIEVRYATSGAPYASFLLVVSEMGQDDKT